MSHIVFSKCCFLLIVTYCVVFIYIILNLLRYLDVHIQPPHTGILSILIVLLLVKFSLITGSIDFIMLFSTLHPKKHRKRQSTCLVPINTNFIEIFPPPPWQPKKVLLLPHLLGTLLIVEKLWHIEPSYKGFKNGLICIFFTLNLEKVLPVLIVLMFLHLKRYNKHYLRYNSFEFVACLKQSNTLSALLLWC